MGKLIRNFTRREVSRSTNVTFNFILQTGWPSSSPLSDPIYFDYVIFERDSWPTGLNNLDRYDFSGFPYYLGNDFYSLKYRSSDGYYTNGKITNYQSAVSPNNTWPMYYNNSTQNAGNGGDNSMTFTVVGY